MKIDFSKNADGLVPAVVQDAATRQVLMVGWMNQEALTETERTKEVVFFSRSKNRLWKKGETSGNILRALSLATDCDEDTILIQAEPLGPTCHTGSYSCFGDKRPQEYSFLKELEATIQSRLNGGVEGSYVASLAKKGPSRVAQKVGEEGVEVALAGVSDDTGRLVSESADLLFHMMVLLKTRGLTLQAVVDELEGRSRARG